MKVLNLRILIGVFSLTVFVLPVVPESVNPPTIPQSAPMNEVERKNLNLVLDWWREVIQGRHTELAEKYQAEDYIQHNPNVHTGRAAFIKFFNSLGPPINPIPTTLSPEPVVKGAKGDLVWLIFEHEKPDPQDWSKTYHFNSFEVIRIEDGKIQEHWDASKKMPDTPPFVAYSGPGPSKWAAGKLSETEEHNLSVATDASKDIFQYWHLELADTLLAPDIIQHNPNIPQGRDGFKQAVSHIQGRTPQKIKPEWKDEPVLSLVDGPFVLFMWERKDKDPAVPTQDYIWNLFDVVRIENGLIKEHWDEGQIAPPN
jgi:predicted SnoaL-like aldol condensation-catalyzing enzyme